MENAEEAIYNDRVLKMMNEPKNPIDIVASNLLRLANEEVKSANVNDDEKKMVEKGAVVVVARAVLVTDSKLEREIVAQEAMRDRVKAVVEARTDEQDVRWYTMEAAVKLKEAAEKLKERVSAQKERVSAQNVRRQMDVKAVQKAVTESQQDMIAAGDAMRNAMRAVREATVIEVVARVLARVLEDAKEADEMVEAVMAAAEMEVAVMVAKKVAMTVVDKAMRRRWWRRER